MSRSQIISKLFSLIICIIFIIFIVLSIKYNIKFIFGIIPSVLYMLYMGFKKYKKHKSHLYILLNPYIPEHNGIIKGWGEENSFNNINLKIVLVNQIIQNIKMDNTITNDDKLFLLHLLKIHEIEDNNNIEYLNFEKTFISKGFDINTLDIYKCSNKILDKLLSPEVDREIIKKFNNEKIAVEIYTLRLLYNAKDDIHKTILSDALLSNKIVLLNDLITKYKINKNNKTLEILNIPNNSDAKQTLELLDSLRQLIFNTHQNEINKNNDDDELDRIDLLTDEIYSIYNDKLFEEELNKLCNDKTYISEKDQDFFDLTPELKNKLVKMFYIKKLSKIDNYNNKDYFINLTDMINQYDYIIRLYKKNINISPQTDADKNFNNEMENLIFKNKNMELNFNIYDLSDDYKFRIKKMIKDIDFDLLKDRYIVDSFKLLKKEIYNYMLFYTLKYKIQEINPYITQDERNQNYPDYSEDFNKRRHGYELYQLLRKMDIRYSNYLESKIDVSRLNSDTSRLIDEYAMQSWGNKERNIEDSNIFEYGQNKDNISVWTFEPIIVNTLIDSKDELKEYLDNVNNIPPNMKNLLTELLKCINEFPKNNDDEIDKYHRVQQKISLDYQNMSGAARKITGLFKKNKKKNDETFTKKLLDPETYA